MLDHPLTRRIGYIAAVTLMLGTVIQWWLPATADDVITIPAESIARLAELEPEECSPVLTKIYDELTLQYNVHQLLLLQAVPQDIPLVVSTVEDSSDSEDPTHWPSPWIAVNELLEPGHLPETATVRGRHAGFDYVHTLVPVDETHSRIILINQAAPAPEWDLQRILMLTAGLGLLIVLFATRE